MKYLFQLSKYFFKKNIKSIISFSIILLISTTLFTSAFVVNKNISNDYDKKFDELNTANNTFTIPSVMYNEEVINDIKELDSVSDVEVIPGIISNSQVKMNDSNQDLTQIFYNKDKIKNISKLNIYLKNKKEEINTIYISNYIYSNSDYKLNDYFDFKIDDNKYSFKINGVVEEMTYGNYASSIIGNYVNNETYNNLLKNNESKEIKTILIRSNDSKKTYNSISKLLVKNNISIMNKGYDISKKGSRLSVSNILVLILFTFSIIILLISLLVTKFKIKQTISDNMSNMGVLKALGYKSKDIIGGMILPYIIVTIISSLTGICLSIPIISTLGNTISSQAGFIFSPKLDLITIIVTIVLNLLLVIIFSYTASRKIKKYNPIDAIRGISKNSGKSNSFEIENTKGNINIIMALKNFTNNISSNLLLGIIIFFITLLSLFVISLFYNVNVNKINFVNTLVEEHPSVVVKEKEYIKDDIKKINNVKDVIYYDESGEINLNDNSYKTFIAENYTSISNDLTYEGKNPSNYNEIAVGSAIKDEFKYEIGDKIKLSKNGNTSEYIIVGFVQSVNNSGEIIEITLDGYRKLDNDYNPKTLYVYLNEETEDKVEDFINNIESKYNNKIDSTINYVKSMNSASSMFLSLIQLITIIIILISLIIIYLVLNILISSFILKKKQELGVLKSIGYETKDLILQIVGSFIPSTIFFTCLGLIISKLFMKNIFNNIFKMVGAYKVSFDYPILMFILVSIFITMLTIVIGILLSNKIKKISVYSLIKD